MKKTILLLFFIIFLYGKNSDTKNIDTMCENGEISLCSAAGFSYANSGNIDKAIALYSNGCKSGDSLSCYLLGRLYFEGNQIKQDFKKAIDLFSKSCKNGQKGSCNDLGVIYEKGKGIKQDYKKASELYLLDCNLVQA